jgi:quercetin dioxygenase-like cupin family protein
MTVMLMATVRVMQEAMQMGSAKLHQRKSDKTMKTVIESVRETYIQNLHTSDWVMLVDEAGVSLPGIRGRPGVAAPTLEGKMIGVDLIEMQPGSAFPTHTHIGTHILCIIQGQGSVQINGIDYHAQAEDTILIPAEYPHHVRALEVALAPLVFLSVGYPHRPLAARNRMHTVK